jgi:hypothetical protein
VTARPQRNRAPARASASPAPRSARPGGTGTRWHHRPPPGVGSFSTVPTEHRTLTFACWCESRRRRDFRAHLQRDRHGDGRARHACSGTVRLVGGRRPLRQGRALATPTSIRKWTARFSPPRVADAMYEATRASQTFSRGRAFRGALDQDVVKFPRRSAFDWSASTTGGGLGWPAICSIGLRRIASPRGPLRPDVDARIRGLREACWTGAGARWDASLRRSRDPRSSMPC